MLRGQHGRRGRPLERRTRMTVKTILVALTTPEAAGRLMPPVTALARRTGAHVIGLHTIEALAVYPGIAMHVTGATMQGFQQAQSQDGTGKQQGDCQDESSLARLPRPAGAERSGCRHRGDFHCRDAGRGLRQRVEARAGALDDPGRPDRRTCLWRRPGGHVAGGAGLGPPGSASHPGAGHPRVGPSRPRDPLGGQFRGCWAERA